MAIDFSCDIFPFLDVSFLALPSSDIAAGTLIGLYEVEKTIGKGYFGKVKRCVHKLTGEKIALKTLRRKQYEKISVSIHSLSLSSMASG